MRLADLTPLIIYQHARKKKRIASHQELDYDF